MTHIKDLTTSGSISPLRESKYFFRSWSQCSNTNVNFLSECSTSCSRTIFRCFSSFSKHISLNADEGTPLNSLKNQFDETDSCYKQCCKYMLENIPKTIGMKNLITSSSSSKRTLFNATISWVSLFFALKTVPYVPEMKLWLDGIIMIMLIDVALNH